MEKIICQLCGRDIEYEYMTKRVQCKHCGIYAIFDEYGRLVRFSTNNNEEKTVQIEPQTQEEIIERSEDKPQMPLDVASATVEQTDTAVDGKRVIKRTLITSLIVMLCAVLLIPIFQIIYTSLKLSEAKELIDKQRYDEAYAVLMKLNGKEAKKLLSKFEWKYTTFSIKDGIQTATIHKYNYNYDGQEIQHEVFYGSRMTELQQTTYNDNGTLFMRLKTFPDSSYKAKEFHYYDDNGNLSHYVYQVNNVTQYEHFYEYDENGNITKETYASADPYSSYYETYIYNEFGKIIETTLFDSDGNIIAHTATEYDSIGNKTTHKKFSWTNGVSLTLTDTYEYDKYGNVTKQENHLYGTKRICEYEYNKNGQIISEKSINNNDETTFIEYIYLDNGLLSKIITHSPAGNVTEKDFAYDKYGNLISEKTIKDSIITSTIEYANYICFYHP